MYLSTGKKKARVWEKIVSDLAKLGLPPARIEHLRKQDDPALIAEVVKELQGKK